MLIDARGLPCPKPVMLAEEAISKIGEGIIEILVDNDASMKNLLRFAKKNSLYTETERIDNYWKIKLVKGYPCEIQVEPQKEKGVFLIIGTDTMGKEDDIGRVLMKGFFDTMKVTKEVPHTIFFLNRGVMLTTTDTEIIPILKDIEAMGVEIFSCGTCLKHYALEAELKVGFRGTTNHIVEGIKEFRKVVWI